MSNDNCNIRQQNIFVQLVILISRLWGMHKRETVVGGRAFQRCVFANNKRMEKILKREKKETDQIISN